MSDDPSRRTCWVCFATEEEDAGAAWVQPCRCKGTSRWVHQACLQRWVDEKQRGNSSANVSCPQCNTKYIILFPRAGRLTHTLDVVDRLLTKVCPYMAGGLLVGSIYWTAVTYGAVTVMQVLGHKEGLQAMEQADPLFLLIGLPTIPVMLFLGRMCRWEDYVLRLWRRHSGKVPSLVTQLFSQAGAGSAGSSAVGAGTHCTADGTIVDQAGASGPIFTGMREPLPPPSPFSDPVSATRVMCGALVLPTVATFCGKTLFSNIHSNLQRTLLGGIAFIGIKGVLKVYYKQQQYVRQAKRVIRDFDEALATQTQHQPRRRHQHRRPSGEPDLEPSSPPPPTAGEVAGSE